MQADDFRNIPVRGSWCIRGIIDRHQIVSAVTFLFKINRLSRWDKSWYDKLEPQFGEAFTAVSMIVGNDQLEQARWSE